MVDTVFAGGLEVGAHGDERGEVVFGAEGATYFVVDFDHPEGSFGHVVRERHTGVFEAGQDLVLFIAEATGEVVGVALPCKPSAAEPSSSR